MVVGIGVGIVIYDHHAFDMKTRRYSAATEGERERAIQNKTPSFGEVKSIKRRQERIEESRKGKYLFLGGKYNKQNQGNS